jgi:hypothetical protein
VLRRIMPKFGSLAKLLISLTSSACRESGQDVGKQDAASLSTAPGGVLHKVTHNSGGKSQKLRGIMNLERVVEARLDPTPGPSRAEP